MQRNILKEIISYKINWIDRRKKIQPLASFRDKIKKTKRNFKKSLQKDRLSFILELKKASPSLGVIRKNFNIKKILKVYKKYATAISVLTDSQFFQGDFKFLSIVHAHTIQPILCKDFFIDPYQIYLARYYQADAILLILSILNDEEYLFLSKTAKSMNMHILTEINNDIELERAISLKAEIIGINNRNLKNFIIDINITKNLAHKIPKKIIIISESGISNYQTVKKLSKFVHGFLIGSALMKSSDLDLAVRRIIFGNNKICGLTLLEDVKVSKKAGAIYAGMIFAHTSPRKILLENAANIIHTVPLRYVGVFQNQKIDYVIFIAITLQLHAVQLHGNESQQYIDKLRQKLSDNIEIWKVFSISDTIPIKYFDCVKYFIFDNHTGGSGITFNWNLLTQSIPNNVLLAGGLNLNNCIKASCLGFCGLDFNSGIEKSPGIKDHQKIYLIFKKLKNSFL